MDRFIYVDKFKTSLTAILNPGDVTANVLDASLLSSITAALAAGDKLPITLENSSNPLIYENTYCTAVSGNQLTLVRGVEGTTAQTWQVNSVVANRVTAQTLYASPVLSYDNRARLRTMSPVETTSAIVDMLGLFTWEPFTGLVLDDDETCFATTSPAGRWCMRAAHPDAAFLLAESYIDNQSAAAAQALWSGKVLLATKANTITSVATNTFVTFTVSVPGALVGDVALAQQPNADAAYSISHSAAVTSAGVVTVVVRNINSASANTNWGTANWTIIVLKG